MRHQRGNLLKRELRLRSHPDDGTGGIAASLCRVSLSGLVCLSRLVYAWSEDKFIRLFCLSDIFSNFVLP